MLHTTTFRRPDAFTSTPNAGHQPGCLSLSYTIAGLYAMYGCNCLLDPEAPLRYYSRQLTMEETKVWESHFDYVTAQAGTDPDEPDEITWCDLEIELTPEAVNTLAGAVTSGLFDKIEIWSMSDGGNVQTLAVGLVYLSLDEDDDRFVAYPIVAVSSEPFDEYKLSLPVSPDPESLPATPVLATPIEHTVKRPVRTRALIVLAVLAALVVTLYGGHSWPF